MFVNEQKNSGRGRITLNEVMSELKPGSIGSLVLDR